LQHDLPDQIKITFNGFNFLHNSLQKNGAYSKMCCLTYA
jgi:hypothetical protein